MDAQSTSRSNSKSDNYRSLNLIATAGVIGTFLCSAIILFGIVNTHTYPHTGWIVLLTSILLMTYSTHLFIEAINSNQKAQNIFSVIFSILLLFMIFIPMKIKPDMLANPIMTHHYFRFLELCYFTQLLFIFLTLHSFRLKDDIPIDKNKIPWTVNLAGFFLFLVCTTFISRFFILYFLDVPMYNNSSYTLLFLAITLMFFTIQFFGKYGPFYRSGHGQTLFTTLSVTLVLIAILHCIGPILREIARLYHYTDQQFVMTLTINRITAVIEILSCIVIFYCMRQKITSQYYYELSLSE